MFRAKWSKLYERKFAPYEDGFSILTFRGAKYVSSAQKDELKSSYLGTLKIDFIGMLKATVYMFVIILIASIAVVSFNLPRFVLEMGSTISVTPVIVVVFRPLWKHFKLSHSILSVAPSLPRRESWLGARLREISWTRIGIGLPIYSVILYSLISVISISSMDWISLFLTIFVGLGAVYLFCAAIWKLTNYPRSKSD